SSLTITTFMTLSRAKRFPATVGAQIVAGRWFARKNWRSTQRRWTKNAEQASGSVKSPESNPLYNQSVVSGFLLGSSLLSCTRIIAPLSFFKLNFHCVNNVKRSSLQAKSSGRRRRAGHCGYAGYHPESKWLRCFGGLHWGGGRRSRP